MIRILLVDDQKVIRQGLKALLESESDLKIIGLAENGKIGIELAEQLQPDVVLVDMYMPIMDGAAATEIICQRCPKTKVLLLSSTDDDKCIADALRAGAMGYLLKNASSEEIADAIRSVHKGYTQLSPGLLKKVMQGNTNTPAPKAEVVSSDFTNTETELLKLLKEPNRLDIQILKSFQTLVSSSTDTKKLLPHLKQKLQLQPDHVGAYYLLGTLLYEHQGQAKVALSCWRKGFKKALEQEFPLESLLLFCRSIFSVNENEAYAGIKQIVAIQGELIPSSIEQTAEQVFSRTSDCFQLLIITWQLKQMNTLLDEHYPLKSKLDALKVGFARLKNRNQVYSL